MLIDELFALEMCPIGGSDPQFRQGWRDRAAAVRKEVLARAQVFNISNVADYLYRDVGESGWDLQRDFPRPMPPFKLIWCEWKFPNLGRRERGGELQSMWIRDHVAERMGCIIWTLENDGTYDEAARWILRFSPFAKPSYNNCQFIGVFPECMMGLDADCNPVFIGGKHVLVNFPCVDEAERPHWSSWNTQDEDNPTDVVLNMLNVPLLAMSLINCRNVRLNTIRTPEALMRANRRRGKHVTAEQHVIEIQPIINRVRAVTGKHGYSRAASPIIRGHFKDYRERGLFGQHKGIFWWDQRINAAQPKEYRMKSAIGDLDSAWPLPKP